jgi:hypothetical protein
LVGAGLVACDQTPQVTDVPLGFNITEGLLVLSDADPTLGTVILSSTAGNCPSFQAGMNPQNIALSDMLTFNLQVQNAVGSYLPLTAGTYDIVMSVQPGAGNYASCTEFETTHVCVATPTGGNSGTVTLQSFSPDAGGASLVEYVVVFGYSRFSGGYALTTCLVPSTAMAPDAGTCVLPGGGGPI